MGIFNKVTDSRVSSILEKEFGEDIAFRFTANGHFRSFELNFDIKPFVGAFADRGIFLIHNAKVPLPLGWGNLLRLQESKSVTGFNLVFTFNRTSPTSTPKEFPYAYWHHADMELYDSSKIVPILDLFIERKKAVGFTDDSIRLHDKWVDYQLRLPVTDEDFLNTNKSWNAPIEVKMESRKRFGDVQDGHRLVYFVGRSICHGLLPPDLLDQALLQLFRNQERNSEMTGEPIGITKELIDLTSLTSNLPDRSTNGILNAGWGSCVIGYVTTANSEWQSPIFMERRLSVIRFREKGVMTKEVLVRNDFHEGGQIMPVTMLSTEESFIRLFSNATEMRLPLSSLDLVRTHLGKDF